MVVLVVVGLCPFLSPFLSGICLFGKAAVFPFGVPLLAVVGVLSWFGGLLSWFGGLLSWFGGLVGLRWLVFGGGQ